MRSAARVMVAGALLIAAVVLAQAKPPAMDEGQGVSPKDAKWVPAKPPLPATIMTSPIAADPGGGSVGYSKYSAGAAIPEHWHTATEYSTVLAGNMRLKLDGKMHDLSPGSYWVAAPRTAHQVTCVGPGECVTLVRRSGPVDYNFVK